jgi:sugar lactone lactonase YvrE
VIQILDEGFHLATGRTSDRRTFVKLDSNAGLPDGLTVDAEGFVWSAERCGNCVSRYDPDGSLERRLHVPAKQVSSLTFGGPDLRDIFVMCAAKSEPTPVLPPVYDSDSGYFGGALFHMNLGIQGQPEYKTRLELDIPMSSLIVP